MKKITFILIGAILFSLAPLRADEGMWMLPLIEKLNNKKLAEIGFKISAKDIYDINKSSLKDAIVHFGGGCTAEMISGEGLLLTNHHCGYGTIQQLSSVENDYLQHGFWAMSRSEELPAPGLTVTFLEYFTDVTDQVVKATAAVEDTPEFAKALQTISNEIVKKAVGDNRYLSGRVASFYGGNAYYLVVSKTYSDVRFVGAPPSSIGKFGADTDNWVWPRHTGDFAIFRVYADKDNNPAPYSPDNKPYAPKKHLTISLKGVQQGDPAMIIGYPGRTNRFMTSAEVKETSATNAITIFVRGVRQEVLMADMEADPKIRLQYSSKYAGSSNFWKKATGMNETFIKLNVAERRAQEEVKFQDWANANPARKAKYGTAIEEIKGAVTNRADALYLSIYLREALSSIELFSLANGFASYFTAVESGTNKENAERMLALSKRRLASFYKNYSAPTDRKVAKALIKLFKDNVKEENRPEFYNIIEQNYNGDIDKYVDFLFDNSVFVSEEKFMKAQDDLELLAKDPAVIAVATITPLQMKTAEVLSKENPVIAKGQKVYIAGQLEMKQGEALYPDANSTMRMTYGQVLDYSPKDAVIYKFYSTLKGVMEKEDPNNWEFVVPDKLKELYKNKDFGQYAMPNGEMPNCFISSNDITGGNSGSPVLNAKGELIGTAFDGNWEAMSGDIIFEPVLQRSINVDIRYTLFIIDKYGGAGYLLNEMTLSK